MSFLLKVRLQLPVVDIVAKPLRSLNIMNIVRLHLNVGQAVRAILMTTVTFVHLQPLISSYILSSINTVLNAFVSPSSYTLDLSR